MRERTVRPCIHVGLPRTATTWIQWHLFAAHDEIFYLGRYGTPKFRERARFGHYRDASIRNLVFPLVHGDVFHADLASCRRVWTESVEPAIARGLVPVLSFESLSLDAAPARQARAENLRAVFGEADIVMTLRRPLDFLESSYFQVLRRENFHGTYRRIRVRRPLRYFTFDEWMEAECEREVRPHLEYADVVESYASLFGRDRVHLFLFEEVCADPERFVRRLCALVGIDPDLGTRLARRHRVNERMTVPQVERLHALASSRTASLVLERANAVLRLWALGMGPRHRFTRAAKARAEIAPRWRAWIEEETRDGNRRLEREWGLPLAANGYPT